MKKLKSHFWYTKNQRNGILLLIGLIVVFQIVYQFVDFSNDELVNMSQTELLAFQNQIDSLEKVTEEKSRSKKYPFNPNYITDYKGSQLGMSIEEIDRLLIYRKKGLFVNSAQEFQKITQVSDSLLAEISPYFKFPEWVTTRDKEKFFKSKPINNEALKVDYKISTIDINKATQHDFESIKGVNESLSERIIKYRNKLQGFSMVDQVFEVWGLNKKIGNEIVKTFKIIKTPVIKKVNVNTATFKEVLSIPYIDYNLCVKIFNYRDEVAELQSISELKNIEDFPVEKYNRIILYLLAQ